MNLKINEELINELMEETKRLFDFLYEKIESVVDKETDIFHRYYDFFLLNNIVGSINLSVENHKNMMAVGHGLGHPFMQTKASKKHNWDNIRLQENPFFLQED